MHEHINDPYVKRAQKDGYRARAAYKLLEINEKDKLIKPGTVLADLGSAPGSWSQVAAKLAGTQGSVFALDIMPMQPIDGVRFIQGDFREESVLAEFEQLLDGRALDLVICDIAPNMAGNSTIDQARSYYLCELALDFARFNLLDKLRIFNLLRIGFGFPHMLHAKGDTEKQNAPHNQIF